MCIEETAEPQPDSEEVQVNKDEQQTEFSNGSQSSKVWKFFKRSADKKLAKCIYCEKEYKTSGNTSNMADHIKRCTSKTSIKSECISNATSEKSIVHFFNRSVEYDKKSRRKKELDEAVTLMIAKDLQPFSIVDDEGFRNLVNKLDPKYVIPSKTTVRNSMMPNIFNSATRKLKHLLDEVNHTAITCDLWSSRATESYLTVTCHFFVNNHELKSVVLSTKPLLEQSNHNAENIARSLNEVFIEWAIKDKVVCVVTDNAKVMVKACDLLGVQQLGCFAHSLNLVVQDALKLDEVRSIVTKCKDIVRFFKSSTIASNMLKKDQDGTIAYKLIQEVPTRWNSTFYMIQRILKIIDQIGRCLLKLKKAPIPLSIEEVLILTEFEKILAGFEDVTKEICGKSYVTISLIIPMTHGLYLNLLQIKKNLKTEEGTNLCTLLTQNLIKRLYPYEQFNIVMVATILDPRFKCDGFLRKENAEKGRTLLENELSKSCDKQIENAPSGQSADTPSEVSGHVLSFLETKISERQQTNYSHVAIVKRYVEMPIVDRKSNPVEFWKNSTQFGPVRQCALKYLCIPATSVESERVFSATGQIISDRRSRLKAKNVDMLTFLHKNHWLLQKL